MNNNRCLILLVLASILLVLANCDYESCTYSSSGSYCSSGCCYEYSSGSRTCQSSTYSCSTYDSYYDTVYSISTGIIVAIVLSSVCFVIIVVVSIVCIVKSIRRRREEEEARMNMGQNTAVQMGEYGNQPTYTDPNMGYNNNTQGNLMTQGNYNYGQNPNLMMGNQYQNQQPYTQNY